MRVGVGGVLSAVEAVWAVWEVVCGRGGGTAVAMLVDTAVFGRCCAKDSGCGWCWKKEGSGAAEGKEGSWNDEAGNLGDHNAASTTDRKSVV